MRYWLWLLVLLAASRLAVAETFPDVLAQVKPSIAGVGTVLPTRTPPGQLRGTGFVVGDGRLLLTSAHVIPAKLNAERNERLVAMVGTGQNPQLRELEVVARDDKHDVVLLRISGSPLRPLVLGSSDEVREGQSLAFTGFPIGAILGLYPVTHRAMVSAVTPIVIPTDNSRVLNARMLSRLMEPFDVFQLDATAYPGNSGGPLYRIDNGEVIGMMNMVFVKESKESVLDKPSGISYAIPIQHARRLLHQWEASHPAEKGK